MQSTIKLDGELDKRFTEIKTHLADQLGYEPTNVEVTEILMAEFSSNASNSPTDFRRGPMSAMED